MSFIFNTAYIGPFAVSLAVGKAGEIQKFRYKIPVHKDLISQGTFVLAGRIQASWSGGFSKDQVFEAGSNLAHDRQYQKAPLVLNEDLTLTALTDCAYICSSAVGIEQKVIIERYDPRADQEIVIPRYELLLVGGEDAAISINGGPVKKGPRLVYARSSELVVHTHSHSPLASLSFAG